MPRLGPNSNRRISRRKQSVSCGGECPSASFHSIHAFFQYSTVQQLGFPNHTDFHSSSLQTPNIPENKRIERVSTFSLSRSMCIFMSETACDACWIPDIPDQMLVSTTRKHESMPPLPLSRSSRGTIFARLSSSLMRGASSSSSRVD